MGTEVIIKFQKRERVSSRFSLFFFCLFLLLASFVLQLDAEVIDKTVAVIDGRIITLSDLLRERTVRAVLGEPPVEDNGALLQQTIEKFLVERQIAEFPGTEASDAEIDAELNKLENRNTVPEETLRRAIARQIRISKYFEVRFRQFIRPSDDDVRKYYEEVFVPAAKSRGLNPVPALEQVVDAVRNNVIEEQLNHDVNIWLEAVRRRSDIEILK